MCPLDLISGRSPGKVCQETRLDRQIRDGYMGPEGHTQGLVFNHTGKGVPKGCKLGSDTRKSASENNYFGGRVEKSHEQNARMREES